jgi:hypothetical protein
MSVCWLKNERIKRGVYNAVLEARADVFNLIELV